MITYTGEMRSTLIRCVTFHTLQHERCSCGFTPGMRTSYPQHVAAMYEAMLIEQAEMAR